MVRDATDERDVYKLGDIVEYFGGVFLRMILESPETRKRMNKLLEYKEMDIHPSVGGIEVVKFNAVSSAVFYCPRAGSESNPLRLLPHGDLRQSLKGCFGIYIDDFPEDVVSFGRMNNAYTGDKLPSGICLMDTTTEMNDMSTADFHMQENLVSFGVLTRPIIVVPLDARKFRLHRYTEDGVKKFVSALTKGDDIYESDEQSDVFVYGDDGRLSEPEKLDRYSFGTVWCMSSSRGKFDGFLRSFSEPSGPSPPSSS